ncbi:MAG: ROK family protein [Pirellulales bacterium]
MSEPAHALGIDIGGTRIKAVALRADGTVVAERIEPSANCVETLLAAISRIVGELAAEGSPIGISAPGLASRDNRSITWMRGRMEAVEGLHWRERLARNVWVLNDGHAAAVGENWLGAARGASHALLLTLGTGVGGGVIVDGRVLQGATGRAGHLGHISLDCRAAPDIVGMPGSLEDCIGNHNLAARSGGRIHDTLLLLQAVAAGDRAAIDCWHASLHGLAVGIASLVNAFDPEIVVLGGGIAESGPALFEPLQAYLDQVEWRPTGARVPLVAAKLGELAGAIGAARFAMLKTAEESSR